MTYPLSDAEVLRAHMVNFKLQDYSPKKVQATLEQAVREAVLGDWPYGIKADWFKNVPPYLRYGTREKKAAIIPLWVKAYREFSEQELKEELRGVEYAVLSKRSQWIGKLFRPVKTFQNYGIYVPAFQAK